MRRREAGEMQKDSRKEFERNGMSKFTVQLTDVLFAFAKRDSDRHAGKINSCAKDWERFTKDFDPISY